jgi:uncharacterized membrane protein (DUF106 family)
MDFVTSLLIVTAAAFINATANSLIAVKIQNPAKLKELQQQVKDYREQLEAAKKVSDTKLLKSLEKRKRYIDTLSNEVSSATLKQSLASISVTIVSFYLMLWLVPAGQTVALISTHLLNPGDGLIKLDTVVWFMVSTIFFSTATRKLFGLS